MSGLESLFVDPVQLSEVDLSTSKLIRSPFELPFVDKNSCSQNTPVIIMPVQYNDAGNLIAGFYSQTNGLFFQEVGYLLKRKEVEIAFSLNDEMNFETMGLQEGDIPCVPLQPSEFYFPTFNDRAYTVEGCKEPLCFVYSEGGQILFRVMNKDQEDIIPKTFKMQDTKELNNFLDDIHAGRYTSPGSGIAEPVVEADTSPQTEKATAPAIHTPSKPKVDLENPREIAAKLDAIVGQDDAKKKLSVAVSRWWVNERQDNVLLIGSTGTGKTEFMRQFESQLGVDSVRINVKQLTTSGYVGADLQDILAQLAIKQQREDPKGIVYLDEVDKLRNDDLFGEGVQDILNTALEGEDVMIWYSERAQASAAKSEAYIPEVVKTHRILFVAGGAFHGSKGRLGGPDIREITENRIQGATKNLGFGADIRTEEEWKADAGRILRRVSVDDIIEYGLKPEFIGRFASIGILDELTREDLRKVIGVNRHDFVGKYESDLFHRGIELRVEPEVYDILVDQAPKRTNARGLKQSCAKLFDQIFFDYKELRDKDNLITVTPELAREILGI